MKSEPVERPRTTDALFALKFVVLLLVFVMALFTYARFAATDPAAFVWRPDAWVGLLMGAACVFAAVMVFSVSTGCVREVYPTALLPLFAGLVALGGFGVSAIRAPGPKPEPKPEPQKELVKRAVADALDREAIQKLIDAKNKEMRDALEQMKTAGEGEKKALREELERQVNELKKLQEVPKEKVDEATEAGVNPPAELPKPKEEPKAEPQPTETSDNGVPKLPPGPPPSKGGGSDPSAFVAAFAAMLMMVAPELLPVFGPLLAVFFTLGTDVKDLPPIAQQAQTILKQGANVDVQAEVGKVRNQEWASPRPAIAALKVVLQRKAAELKGKEAAGTITDPEKEELKKLDEFARELELTDKLWAQHGDICLALTANGCLEVCKELPGKLDAGDAGALKAYLGTVPTAAAKKADPARWVQAVQAYLNAAERGSAVRVEGGRAVPYHLSHPKKLADAKKVLADAWKALTAGEAKTTG